MILLSSFCGEAPHSSKTRRPLDGSKPFDPVTIRGRRGHSDPARIPSPQSRTLGPSLAWPAKAGSSPQEEDCRAYLSLDACRSGYPEAGLEDSGKP